MSEKTLQNSVAMVTGAASGIGRAAAQLLAAQGATVYFSDINLPGVQTTGGSGRCLGMELDVTSEPAWETSIARIIESESALNILINCAGIAAVANVCDQTLDDWRKVMSVNLEGAMLGTKHAIRAMRQTNARGSIVNVASVSGIKAQPGSAAYCASKAALLMLTQVAALECVKNGDPIRVNAVSPGGVRTPMWHKMPFFQKMIEEKGSEQAAWAALEPPGQPFATPEQISQAIVFLTSDAAVHINGTNLVIDNGYGLT
jgi:NAD(P)-dependent dehydrogenase (short-subunit alcohol dehydrogenase family)